MGFTIVIVRSFYEMKIFSDEWLSKISRTMSDIGFSSCLPYPDVWMQKAMKSYGFKCWWYVLIQTYDIIVYTLVS